LIDCYYGAYFIINLIINKNSFIMDSTSWFLVIVFSIMTVIMIIASIVRNRIERKKIAVPEGFCHLVMDKNKIISVYGSGEKYLQRADDTIIVLEGNSSKFVVSFDDILKICPSSPEIECAVTVYCRVVNIRKALLMERVSANNFNIMLVRAIQNKVKAILTGNFPETLPCADTVSKSKGFDLGEVGVKVTSIDINPVNSVEIII